MVKWMPDDCHNGVCLIEAPGVGFSPVTFIFKCQRHENVQNLLTLTDAQLHNIIVFSSRRREYARWETQQELAASEPVPFFNRRDFLRYVVRHGGELPPAPYCRMELDGEIKIVSGLAGVALTNLQTRVANRLASIGTESGTSSVVVS